MSAWSLKPPTKKKIASKIRKYLCKGYLLRTKLFPNSTKSLDFFAVPDNPSVHEWFFVNPHPYPHPNYFSGLFMSLR